MTCSQRNGCCVVGCNTSGYHGLLVGSLNPPVNRIMALSNCLEMVIFNGDSSPSKTRGNPNAQNIFNLSTFEFDSKLTPPGFAGIRSFRRDLGVHFDYEFDRFALTKSVYLLRDSDTVAVQYDFKHLSQPAELTIRPLVGLRDFHSLQKSYSLFAYREHRGCIGVHHRMPGSPELLLSCPAATFERDEQWWFNFVYRVNRERGQGFTEDLWTPGFFKARISSPTRIVFAAKLSADGQDPQAVDIDIDQVRQKLLHHRREITAGLPEAADPEYKILSLAADQFITNRHTQNGPCATILAGYPWFADWGRDAFIALPGLMLATGRYDEARSVLTTFAVAADRGMIPNRFDDGSNTAHFNSVDASLWFIHAAFQYLNTTGDLQIFTQQILPVIRSIVESYQSGTRFDIHADTDGLITAGDIQTQLTWMDAKYDGVAFTPRYGKPVEVNALWYNALRLMAGFYAERKNEDAGQYKAMAEQVGESFGRLFWNEENRHLNDCILPDGSVDSSLRPNQIFAVSLPFSPLTQERQRAVVDAVRENLLTPCGLRSLSPQDERYKATYAGSPRGRDEAYHQGTVWAFLMGPFIEAYLKVNEFSKDSRKAATELIAPLLQHITEDACLGSISEIFDGDAPHTPRGCIAQAWSVAELLRAHRLINS